LEDLVEFALEDLEKDKLREIKENFREIDGEALTKITKDGKTYLMDMGFPGGKSALIVNKVKGWKKVNPESPENLPEVAAVWAKILSPIEEYDEYEWYSEPVAHLLAHILK
jgi:hypothetical protein